MTKVSALPAASTLAAADQIPIVQGGVSKVGTMQQVAAFVDPLSNSSIAAQTGFAADTYLAGSNPLNLAAGRLKAGTGYRCRFDIAKTAAGTATAVVIVRLGTAASTADAALVTFTFPSAQTAAIDNGYIDIMLNFRSVGTGTSAVVAGTLTLNRTGTTAGFLSTGGLQNVSPIRVTSAGFNSSTVTQIGVSINAGTSAAWTVTTVQSELKNLA